MTETNDTATPSIRRTFQGGSEEICFSQFARYVVQEDEMAELIARRMLGGQDPYPYNEDEPAFYETFEVIDAEALRAQVNCTVSVSITSFFTGQTWEGEVELDLPADAPDEQKLERIWRLFNRLEEADAVRLDEIGFRQPPMSMGDTVVMDGVPWTPVSAGFKRIYA